MRRTILHTLAAVAFLFLVPGISLACSCDLPPMNKTEEQLIELERKKSKAVFVGEVIEIIVPKTASGEPAWFAEVRFKVQRKWKGAVTEDVSVYTGNVCCICGYKFEVGESYLVYAYGTDRLSTNICTRTAKLSEAEKDLKVLGKAMPPKHGKA
jgi:hypothetical protein